MGAEFSGRGSSALLVIASLMEMKADLSTSGNSNLRLTSRDGSVAGVISAQLVAKRGPGLTRPKAVVAVGKNETMGSAE